MHMADALVTPAVGAAMYAASAAATARSVRKLRIANDSEKIPLMGVMGAFVFSAQMINFTIPGTGSSGHLCGGMLLTALLGPQSSFLTMIAVLLIQCLLFADGGLLALGCNIWNMAFYGCFLGYFLWRPLMRRGLSRGRIIAASIAGCVLTLQLGAFSVVLETTASGISVLPIGLFAAVMQPIHLAIGLMEGLITAAVLLFVYESRPQLLMCGQANENASRFSFRKTIAILTVLALLTGGALSLVASSNPDGLEWSIARLTGSTEIGAAAEDGSTDNTGSAEGIIHRAAAAVQETTALLPDYAFRGGESDAGTSVSGIVGAVAVVLLCIGGCCLFRLLRRKSGRNDAPGELS